MGYLIERVSYLRGLADGMKLDKDSNEVRLLDEIIELIDDIATSVESLEEQQDDLSETLADLEEDFCDLEDYIYEDEDELCCDELECPNCGSILSIDEDILDDSDEITIKCPNCGEDVSIDFECDGDCCGCAGCDDEEEE
ncbi:MAG: hypothetical protein IJZ94_01770 [Clostridia bacterium]|nr:hypothetical protein [Clostridia bacterium]